MLKKIRLVSIACVLVAIFIQIAVFPSEENTFSAILAGTAAVLTLHMMLSSAIFQRYPLSALQVLMFAVAMEIVPLIGTLIGFHPLTFNLLVPVKTFQAIALTQIVLLISHWAYRKSRPLASCRQWLTFRVHQKLGLFATPWNYQIWIMGLLGSAAMYYVFIVIRPEITMANQEGVLVKFLRGLLPFAYAPFLLPVLQFFVRKEKRLGAVNWLLLIAYFLVILAISLGRNSRGAFASAVVTTGICFVLAVLIGNASPRRLRLKLILPIGIAMILFANVLGDLAIAMQYSRSLRGKVTPWELMSRTWDTFQNKAILNMYSNEVHRQASIGLWTENYTNNVFLDRFTCVKFCDNITQATSQYSETQRVTLRSFTYFRALSILPGPVLSMLGFQFDKRNFTLISMGSMIWYSVYPYMAGQGTFASGSMIAHGMAAFGYFYPFVLGVISILLFVLVDSFARRIEMAPASERAPQVFRVIIAPVALMSCFDMSMLFSGDSVNALLAYAFRGFAELAILYFLVFKFTQFIGAFLLPVSRSMKVD